MDITVEFGPILHCMPRQLPAQTYRYFFLLTRRLTVPLFVPLRSLQILTILTPHEIVFLHPETKHQALLRWHDFQTHDRDRLDAPVAFQVTHYHRDAAQWQARIPAEFDRALILYSAQHLPPVEPSVTGSLPHSPQD